MNKSKPFDPVDILSSVDIGFYAVCQDKVLYVNSGCARLTGYSQTDLALTEPFSFVSSDDRALLDEAIRKVTGNEPTEPLDLRLISKNGKTIWVLARFHVMPHSGQKAVLASLSDITGRRLREKERRTLENRHGSIFEGLPDVYYETDLKGNITFANRAMSVHLGYSREELLGMNNRQYTDEESAQRVYEAFHQLYLTGKPVTSIEETVIRKDGSRGIVDLSASLIRDQAGRPIGFAGISREITRRKQMEQALRQAEERYRNTIENIQDGYFEIGLDGRWTFFNDVVCQHMQYSREELMGMDYHQMHTQQSARNTVKAFAHAYSTGNPIKSIEIECVRKDRSIGYYELSVTPIKDTKGQMTGFRCISRDITERIKMESELRLSEERYRTIIDEMEEWYFESDANGHLLFFNEAIARALGRRPHELAGAHFRDLMAPEEADKIYNAFHRVYVTAEPVRNVPYRFTAPGGAGMLSEFSIFPKRDELGRVMGFRAVGHDITQKKKMQHQQMLSEKMATIGRLAAGAAQKIHHPIASIDSNLKAIAEYLDDVVHLFSLTSHLAVEASGPATPEAPNLQTRLSEIQEMAEKTKMDFVLDDLGSLVRESQDGAEQIIRIVRDLETYGQKDDDPPKPANLNDLLEMALNSVWKALKYKAQVIRNYGDLPPVVCHARQIQQVFSNLLVNAGEAIADEGEIRLSTRREGDHSVAICIADTGSGIPEETLSRIFDPFFTTKDLEKSTGLGLHVVFSIIERHSGKIEVESKPSAGTTFTLTLPA